MIRLYDWFGGRCSFYAFFFAMNGTALAYMGKLTMPFVALITGLQAWVVVHSAKEDWAAMNGVPKPIPPISTTATDGLLTNKDG